MKEKGIVTQKAASNKVANNKVATKKAISKTATTKVAIKNANKKAASNKVANNKVATKKAISKTATTKVAIKNANKKAASNKVATNKVATKKAISKTATTKVAIKNANKKAASNKVANNKVATKKAISKTATTKVAKRTTLNKKAITKKTSTNHKDKAPIKKPSYPFTISSSNASRSLPSSQFIKSYLQKIHGKSTDSKPLSPHIWIWRWHINMLSSIFHRISGIILFSSLFILSLTMIMTQINKHAFKTMYSFIMNPYFIPLWAIALFALLYHSLNGIRHLLLDINVISSYEMGRITSYLVVFLSLICVTAVFFIL